jgi:hypothetical protein
MIRISRASAARRSNEAKDGGVFDAIFVRSSEKKLLKGSKKAATKAAPSMYTEMGLHRRELPVFCPLGGSFFVRWAALSVGRLFCSLLRPFFLGLPPQKG